MLDRMNWVPECVMAEEDAFMCSSKVLSGGYCCCKLTNYVAKQADGQQRGRKASEGAGFYKK